MSLGTFFAVYAISLPVFFIIDLLWIGLVANKFYNSQIGALRGDINWTAALLFYFIFLLGLTYFAAYPAVMRGTIYTALTLGALYGFFTYAAYDLTNMATLKGWTWPMTVVDIAWGTVLGASITAVTYWIYTSFIA